MKNRKLKVICEELEMTCWKCEGKGTLFTNCCDGRDCACKGLPIYYSECDMCNGTGIWIEKHYYHIVNGICIDGDTVK